MTKALLVLFTVAIFGSMLVPLTVLVMARLGYLEPVQFVAFGRRWRFQREQSPSVSRAPILRARLLSIEISDLFLLSI
jgi:hypothetical protein